MGSWDERYTYVKTIVKKVKKKQARSESEERDSSYEWNVSSTEEKHKQVCRKILASTLGVSERTLCSWLTKEKQNVVPTVEPEVTNPQTINKPLSEEDKQFLEEWLLAIPTVPSHYCRKQPSYEGKRLYMKDVRDISCIVTTLKAAMKRDLKQWDGSISMELSTD